jgi:hypothetical protein
MGEPDLRQHIEAIQSGLRRAGRQMVLSSSQAVLRGLFVLAGCALSLVLRTHPVPYMVGLWVGIVSVDLVIEVLLYVRLARKSPGAFVTGLEKQLLKFIVLLVLVAGVLTYVLMRRGQEDLVPGVWMLLVGATYVAVGLFSFSRTWVLGLCACAGGAASLFLAPLWALVVLAGVLGLGSVSWGAILVSGDSSGEE